MCIQPSVLALAVVGYELKLLCSDWLTILVTLQDKLQVKSVLSSQCNITNTAQCNKSLNLKLVLLLLFTFITTLHKLLAFTQDILSIIP